MRDGQEKTGEDSVTASIVAFLTGIGIPVETGILDDKSFLPAMIVRNGGLVFDPARLEWPGDLLHEAGHIAVTEPALRPTLSEIRSDPAEEMTAIAWSYAAALAIGLDPAVLFHEAGYKGASESILENFTAGRYFGVPMLEYHGMTTERRRADREGLPAYPHMLRWLR